MTGVTQQFFKFIYFIYLFTNKKYIESEKCPHFLNWYYFAHISKIKTKQKRKTQTTYLVPTLILLCYASCSQLRVQNESSFRRKKDSFYVILKRKYSFHWDLNPDLWITRQTLYRWATWLADKWTYGHKSSIYQVQNILFTNQSGVHNCRKMTNYEQFWTKWCVKIAATLTLAPTDVFLIKMCQACYNSRESWVF